MTDTIFQAFQPNTENRFIVEFPDAISIPRYLCYKTSPIRRVNNIWEPVIFYFWDSICPSTRQCFEDIVRLNPSGFDIHIDQLGPVGDKVSEQILHSCMITVLDFGKNDYFSEVNRSLMMTVQPSYCEIKY
jgi:hypothetical protein